MTRGNDTAIRGFTLLGFSPRPEKQPLLILTFLAIYSLILTGNTLVLLATAADPALRTPMYFFLRNLAFLEMCYASVTLPTLLAGLLAESTAISFSGCAVQMGFFLLFGTAVCYLLAAMAYDRYVAICRPLHYPARMSRGVCRLLVSGCWLAGVSVSLGQTALVFSTPFCGSRAIDHFFCDVPVLVRQLCPGSLADEVEKVLMSVLVIVFPFALLLVSYVRIIGTVLGIPAVDGKQKAMQTCSSHLLSVSLFYGSAMVRYLVPNSGSMPGMEKMLSLLYTVAPALLNPIIYSLRNQQVKEALRKMTNWHTTSPSLWMCLIGSGRQLKSWFCPR